MSGLVLLLAVVSSTVSVGLPETPREYEYWLGGQKALIAGEALKVEHERCTANLMHTKKQKRTVARIIDKGAAQPECPGLIYPVSAPPTPGGQSVPVWTILGAAGGAIAGAGGGELVLRDRLGVGGVLGGAGLGALVGVALGLTFDAFF